MNIRVARTRLSEAQRDEAPSPALTPNAVLALQPTVGNAALARLFAEGRVLARTRAKDVEPLADARGLVQGYRDVVAALENDKARFQAMYDHLPMGFVKAQTKALLDHIAAIDAAVADVEAENNPGAAWKRFGTANRAARAERQRLEKFYGEEEVQTATAAFTTKRVADAAKEKKATERAATEGARKQELQDQRTQEAAAEEQRERKKQSAFVKPSVVGPAYQHTSTIHLRAQIRNSVEVFFPAFRNLGKFIGDPACFIYHLETLDLEQLQSFLEKREVTTFEKQNLPASRKSGGGLMVIPTRVSGLNADLGGEFFCDWVWNRRGHGWPISRVAKAFEATGSPRFLAEALGTQELSADGRKYVYQWTSSEQRMVTSVDRSAIITFYATS